MSYQTSRTEAASKVIANIRKLADSEGASDTGQYLMWLEDRLYEAWRALDLDQTSAPPNRP